MKNKGFTLIELISVLVILTIVAVITTAVISSVLKNYRDSLYNKQLDSIKSAAKVWSGENTFLLPTGDSGECSYKQTCSFTTYKSFVIKLSDLQKEGYIDSNLKNVKTKEYYDADNVTITITKNNKKLSYQVNVEE